MKTHFSKLIRDRKKVGEKWEMASGLFRIGMVNCNIFVICDAKI
jgi:hypothetical protein